MSKTPTIAWAPFTDKHVDYIHKGMEVGMSVAEGAIRSGKTVDNCIIASMFLEAAPDKFHLATGSTVGNAKLNIGVCNGYGLENLFRGRCRWGKYRDNEALFIQTLVGERIVIFAGGAKADSYKSILGNSYGLWIATEINEHYDSEDSRTSFVKVAMGRQLAAKQNKTLWDLNPCHPKHRIYRDYIDAYLEKGLANGYQHQLFTLHDNASIPEDRKRDIESRYTPGSVWHSRDILGNRTVAEGLCYRSFADNVARHHVDREKADFDLIRVGGDFGGNGSKHAWVATGIKHDRSKVTALMSKTMDATDTTPEDIYTDFRKFANAVQTTYGRIDLVFLDSAEQVLISGLRERNPSLTIRNSVKNEIKQRIRALNSLISQGRFYYTDDAATVRDAMSECQYDPKKQPEDVRQDDGTTDIDTMDAFEYSWEADIKYYV